MTPRPRPELRRGLRAGPGKYRGGAAALRPAGLRCGEGASAAGTPGGAAPRRGEGRGRLFVPFRRAACLSRGPPAQPPAVPRVGGRVAQPPAPGKPEGRRGEWWGATAAPLGGGGGGGSRRPGRGREARRGGGGSVVPEAGTRLALEWVRREMT